MLNKNDDQWQIDKDKATTQNDRFYGWEIDVAGTWYQYCPHSLNDRDSFYADSSYRFY
jgi:hypothetical protein